MATDDRDSGLSGTTQTGAAGDIPPPPSKVKTFTQDEVSALMAKESKQGKSAGAKSTKEQIAELFGLEDPEALSKAAEVYKAALAAEEGRKDEVTKAAEAAAAARAEAEQLGNEYRRGIRQAALESALRTVPSGSEDVSAVKEDRLQFAVNASIGPVLAASDDDLSTVIEETVNNLRSNVPELFGSGNGGPALTRTPPPAGRPVKERTGGSNSTSDEVKAALERINKRSKPYSI